MEEGSVGEGKRSSVVERCNGTGGDGSSAHGRAGVILGTFANSDVKKLESCIWTGEFSSAWRTGN